MKSKKNRRSGKIGVSAEGDIRFFSKIESAFKAKQNLMIFFNSIRKRDLEKSIDIAKQEMVENIPDLTEIVHPGIVKGNI